MLKDHTIAMTAGKVIIGWFLLLFILVLMQGSSLGQELENQKQSTPTVAANILADSDGYLDLGSLIDLPVDIAKHLGRSMAAIRLSGLQELSEDAGIALSENRGGFLDLEGLSKLSDKAAVAIVRYKGFRLVLGGVTELSDRAAEAFVDFKGDLDLREVTTMSERAADALICPSQFWCSIPRSSNPGGR